MVRKLTLSICLLVGCVWCFALVSRVDSAPPGEAGGSFKPVASVHGLMNGQGLVFKNINMALSNQRMPERHERIEAFAEVLAELANVNTLNSDKPDYRQWAGQLRATAMELAEEAEKEDGADDEKMKTLFEQLKSTCQACHDAYQDKFEGHDEDHDD